MKTSDIEKGTKVVTPSGDQGKVTAIRKVKTGLKGRPTTLFAVSTKSGTSTHVEEFRAKDLKSAA